MTDPEDYIVFPPGMPEEDQEKIKKSMRDGRYHALVEQHRIAHFFDALDEEGLLALRTIVQSLTVTKSAHQSGYYIGVITQMLVHKFGYCRGCGAKHDDELAAMLKDAHNESGTDNVAAPSGPKQEAQGENLSAPTSWSEVPLEPEFLENLAIWGMNLVTNEYPKVACKNCGLEYVSLEDRMLKTPDNCHGCHHKAAHG